MYAILMKKEILSNDIILYNPMTVIEGSYDEENDYFIDKFDNEFYKIDDSSFAFSELSEGIYFTITEEELLSRYGINTIEEALNYYQDDVFSNFTFAINNGKEKLVVHQVSLSELKELVNNDNLASSYYNGMVSIPKRKLYMLTQLNDEKKLRSFIDYSVKSLKEFERHKTNTEEKDLTKKVNVNINKKENGNNKNIRREIDTEELESYLKERVIGQDENIENLVTVISDNYKTYDPHLIQRPLITGPSGVGKTETLKLLAEYLDIPFTKYSTPTLSGAGYVGKDIDDI